MGADKLVNLANPPTSRPPVVPIPPTRCRTAHRNHQHLSKKITKQQTKERHQESNIITWNPASNHPRNLKHRKYWHKTPNMPLTVLKKTKTQIGIESTSKTRNCSAHSILALLRLATMSATQARWAHLQQHQLRATEIARDRMHRKVCGITMMCEFRPAHSVEHTTQNTIKMKEKQRNKTAVTFVKSYVFPEVDFMLPILLCHGVALTKHSLLRSSVR